MKRLLSFVLIMAMSITAFAGCGDSKKDNNTTTTETTTQAKTGSDNSEEEVDRDVEPELELIVAHNQTSLDNPYAFGLIKFKDTVEEVSNGKIAVTVHHGTLGDKEDELIEKLEMGAADMVVASPGFMTSIGVPEIEIFSLLYLFNDFDHWEKCLDGEFGTAMKDVVNEKTGNAFRIMDYWSSSVRDYYGKKEVKAPADVKGLKIRTQSSDVQKKFWEQCGAIPTSVAWGELYQALEQGVVDGAENDYTNLMQKDHHKTKNGKFISETHHDYTTRLLLMSGQFYDGLTDEQKGWIDEAVKAATEEEREAVYRMFDESKQKVIEDGATVTEYADIDIDAFKAIAIPIQDEFAQKYNMTNYLEMIRSAAN